MSDLSTPDPIVKFSEEWWASRSSHVQDRRCIAHKKTGERCGKVSMEAQQVCGTHGGRAPQSRMAARRRIEEAAEKLARKLIGIALDDNKSEGAQITAIRDLLDRAGVSAKTAVEVEIEVKPYQRLANEIVGFAPTTRAESRALRGIPETGSGVDTSAPSDGEIVDAEIVDEPPADPGNRAGRTYWGDADDMYGGRPGATTTPPGSALMSFEEASAIAAESNRRAGVYDKRRR